MENQQIIVPIHGSVVSYDSRADSLCVGWGRLHNGTIIGADGVSRICSVFFPNDDNIWNRSMIAFNSNSNYYVRYWASGMDYSNNRFFVTERLERKRNVYQHFKYKRFNNRLRGESSFDQRGFLKEEVGWAVRGIMQTFDRIEDNFPLIDEYGETAFMVGGQIKWLIAGGLHLTQKEAGKSLLNLFQTLLDSRGMVDEEEKSFYRKYFQFKSFYHPFVLTLRERERFPLRFQRILEARRPTKVKALFWTDTVENNPPLEILRVVYGYHRYKDTLPDVSEFLRNLATHIDEERTLWAYRNAMGDKNAQIPPLIERLIALIALLGDDYLVLLWKWLESEDCQLLVLGTLA